MLAHGGGRIVNIGSGLAVRGLWNSAVASASQGAIRQLTQSLALEWARKNIRVNAIAPSLVDTPLGQTVAGNPKMAEAVAKMHAIPRLGRPDDIAAMGELLLTEGGSWITGQVIGIDGGRSAIRVMKS